MFWYQSVGFSFRSLLALKYYDFFFGKGHDNCASDQLPKAAFCTLIGLITPINLIVSRTSAEAGGWWCFINTFNGIYAQPRASRGLPPSGMGGEVNFWMELIITLAQSFLRLYRCGLVAASIQYAHLGRWEELRTGGRSPVYNLILPSPSSGV